MVLIFLSSNKLWEDLVFFINHLCGITESDLPS